ncbi:hypothetical protein WK57_30330 [Burkholderia ubonensis]|uniref:Uncharacterized protein n=1 Tax=Burkholderia ubonensis TaxID=101571 RepID=A0AA40R514_9BURK|nr:hypothetical protein [Burkholderia ubonensis]KVN92536.1 hypothetical protein WJ68_33475 [Burkholderia ubonensis]KVZ57510.1 hypothetical protein WL19_03335 [Burkholderia ubonensis]KWZ53287.1 hypothetical protein WK57_30330 [Burkholderia ubonensis]
MSNAEQKTISIADLDLSAASNDGHEFEVISPKTGKGLGVFITVLGDQSEKVVAFTRKRQNEKRREAAIAIRRGRPSDDIDTVEDDESFVVEACIVRVTGWRGLAEEFSEANARLLFTTNREIRRQVLEESANLANFTKV